MIAPDPSRVGVVISDGLHLHETIDGPILDTLTKGDPLQVLESRKRKVEWHRVRVVRTGQQGWVAARFVKVTEIPVARKPPTKKKTINGWLFWLIGAVIVVGLAASVIFR